MPAPSARPTITFDVYSALVDSRTGGTRACMTLAEHHGWSIEPQALYARWDALCKELQRDTVTWVPFRTLAAQAMDAAQRELDLRGDPLADTDALLSTIGSWPHYSDVPDALARVAAEHDVAVLTNIDDDLLAQTDPGWAFPTAITSEAAACYKPHPEIYRFAQERVGPLVHVAASARDVRGSLEAGLDVVRVVRPGHHVDADGPAPTWVIEDLRELPAELGRMQAR